MGFEPTTASLEGWNSTTELRPHLSLQRLLQLIFSQSQYFAKNIKTSYFILMRYLQSAGHGGQARVRTLEADGSRFTVCPR